MSCVVPVIIRIVFVIRDVIIVLPVALPVTPSPFGLRLKFGSLWLHEHHLRPDEALQLVLVLLGGQAPDQGGHVIPLGPGL